MTKKNQVTSLWLLFIPRSNVFLPFLSGSHVFEHFFCILCVLSTFCIIDLLLSFEFEKKTSIFCLFHYIFLAIDEHIESFNCIEWFLNGVILLIRIDWFLYKKLKINCVSWFIFALNTHVNDWLELVLHFKRDFFLFNL